MVVNPADGLAQKRRHRQDPDLFQGRGLGAKGNGVGHRHGLKERPLNIAHRVAAHYRVGGAGVHRPHPVAQE